MATTRDFLVGVVIGSALGAAAALLYAPAAGTETRQIIKDRTGEALDRTTELAGQARTRVSDLASQTQNRASEVVQQTQARVSDMAGQVRSKAGELTQQVQGAVDRGRQAVEQQKDAVLSAVEAGRQAFAEKKDQLQQDVADDTAAVTTETENLAGGTTELGQTTEASEPTPPPA